MKTKILASFGAVAVAVGIMVIIPTTASAHCDTMDGPVIGDAQKALEENNINYISKWVLPEDDEEIAKIFDQTMEVRDDSPEAQKLADQYLYENLVRIHRAGEGASYTGVKPLGTPMEEVIAAADESIRLENLTPFEGIVEDEKVAELEDSFNQVLATKDFDVNDVDAGRQYVSAYVTFTHLAEGEHAEEGEHHDAETLNHETEHEIAEEAIVLNDSKEETTSMTWISWLLAGVFFITTIIGFSKKRR